jgi:hypothetical protein
MQKFLQPRTGVAERTVETVDLEKVVPQVSLEEAGKPGPSSSAISPAVVKSSNGDTGKFVTGVVGKFWAPSSEHVSGDEEPCMEGPQLGSQLSQASGSSNVGPAADGDGMIQLSQDSASSKQSLRMTGARRSRKEAQLAMATPTLAMVEGKRAAGRKPDKLAEVAMATPTLATVEGKLVAGRKLDKLAEVKSPVTKAVSGRQSLSPEMRDKFQGIADQIAEQKRVKRAAKVKVDEAKAIKKAIPDARPPVEQQPDCLKEELELMAQASKWTSLLARGAAEVERRDEREAAGEEVEEESDYSSRDEYTSCSSEMEGRSTTSASEGVDTASVSTMELEDLQQLLEDTNEEERGLLTLEFPDLVFQSPPISTGTEEERVAMITAHVKGVERAIATGPRRWTTVSAGRRRRAQVSGDGREARATVVGSVGEAKGMGKEGAPGKWPKPSDVQELLNGTTALERQQLRKVWADPANRIWLPDLTFTSGPRTTEGDTTALRVWLERHVSGDFRRIPVPVPDRNVEPEGIPSSLPAQHTALQGSPVIPRVAPGDGRTAQATVVGRAGGRSAQAIEVGRAGEKSAQMQRAWNTHLKLPRQPKERGAIERLAVVIFDDAPSGWDEKRMLREHVQMLDRAGVEANVCKINALANKGWSIQYDSAQEAALVVEGCEKGLLTWGEGIGLEVDAHRPGVDPRAKQRRQALTRRQMFVHLPAGVLEAAIEAMSEEEKGLKDEELTEILGGDKVQLHPSRSMECSIPITSKVSVKDDEVVGAMYDNSDVVMRDTVHTVSGDLGIQLEASDTRGGGVGVGVMGVNHDVEGEVQANHIDVINDEREGTLTIMLEKRRAYNTVANHVWNWIRDTSVCAVDMVGNTGAMVLTFATEEGLQAALSQGVRLPTFGVNLRGRPARVEGRKGDRLPICHKCLCVGHTTYQCAGPARCAVCFGKGHSAAYSKGSGKPKCVHQSGKKMCFLCGREGHLFGDAGCSALAEAAAALRPGKGESYTTAIKRFVKDSTSAEDLPPRLKGVESNDLSPEHSQALLDGKGTRSTVGSPRGAAKEASAPSGRMIPAKKGQTRKLTGTITISDDGECDNDGGIVNSVKEKHSKGKGPVQAGMGPATGKTGSTNTQHPYGEARVLRRKGPITVTDKTETMNKQHKPEGDAQGMRSDPGHTGGHEAKGVAPSSGDSKSHIPEQWARIAEQEAELQRLYRIRDGLEPAGPVRDGVCASNTGDVKKEDEGNLQSEEDQEAVGQNAGEGDNTQPTDRQRQVMAWARILERRLTNMMTEDTYIEVGLQAVLDEAAYMMRQFRSADMREEMAKRTQPMRAAKKI